MKNVAAFEAEPQADAVASTLREHGFEAEVIPVSDESYDDRIKAFFQGRPRQYEAHAFVESNADRETFMRAVQHHYGHVVESGIV